MAESLGHKAAKGAVWASIEKFSMMGLQFGVNLILARLLLPADFGAIGMLAIFIAVSQVLIDGGFGSALIQKKNPTQTDYSTIFFWNLAFSSFLYLILFLCAPLIADYYDMPILSGVLRGIGISLITNSVVAVQRVRLQKSLAFKTLAITNLSAYIFGSVIAIIMAYYNTGVWSLVAMQVISSVMAVLVLALLTHWTPTLCLSRQSMRELFGFGGYIMAATMLQEICRNIQGIIIGKKFSATQMGYYSQAYKLDHITSYSIPQVIVQVMYPVFSSIQDDLKRLNEMVLLNMRVIAFTIFPILSILIIIAQPLISLLYGDKWLPSAPYFQVLCVGGFFLCLQNVNFYAVASVGKSKSLFKWSFYKWGVMLVALLVGMNFGMYGILWGMVLSSLNIFLVNAYLASKHTKLTLLKQLQAILPITTLVTLGIFIVYWVSYLNVSKLILCFIFLGIYIFTSIGFKLKAWADFRYVLNKIIFKN